MDLPGKDQGQEGRGGSIDQSIHMNGLNCQNIWCFSEHMAYVGGCVGGIWE